MISLENASLIMSRINNGMKSFNRVSLRTVNFKLLQIHSR